MNAIIVGARDSTTIKVVKLKVYKNNKFANFLRTPTIVGILSSLPIVRLQDHNDNDARPPASWTNFSVSNIFFSNLPTLFPLEYTAFYFEFESVDKPTA